MTPAQYQAFTVRANGRVLKLISEVEIFAPSPIGVAPTTPGRKYFALYDTGATHSAISPQVVQDLALPIIRARTVGVGGGDYPTTSHLVNIGLPNRVMFAMAEVAKLPIPSGENVIIGMDIIGAGDFAVTHHGGNTTFSLCFPSMRCIDFAAEVNSYAKSHQPAKNALCPCKSGKKFKSCCGRHR